MLHQIAGIQVLKARDGLEAIRIYRSDRFKTCCKRHISLVLMDLNMPVMDGCQAARAIFEDARQFKAK